MPEQTYLIITLRIPTDNVETGQLLYSRIKTALSTIEGIVFAAKMTIQMDLPTLPE